VLGIEYSHYLYENLLKEKFPNGEVIEGDVADIPFEDSSFDVVYCSDVLEHLPEWKVDKAISEIYRVTKKYFYGTISDHIDVNKKFHLTVKPYSWWKNKFIDKGFSKKEVPMRRHLLHVYEKNLLLERVIEVYEKHPERFKQMEFNLV